MTMLNNQRAILPVVFLHPASCIFDVLVNSVLGGIAHHTQLFLAGNKIEIITRTNCAEQTGVLGPSGNTSLSQQHNFASYNTAIAQTFSGDVRILNGTNHMLASESQNGHK